MPVFDKDFQYISMQWCIFKLLLLCWHDPKLQTNTTRDAFNFNSFPIRLVAGASFMGFAIQVRMFIQYDGLLAPRECLLKLNSNETSWCFIRQCNFFVAPATASGNDFHPFTAGK
jgi:hypothetical protein